MNMVDIINLTWLLNYNLRSGRVNWLNIDIWKQELLGANGEDRPALVVLWLRHCHSALVFWS